MTVNAPIVQRIEFLLAEEATEVRILVGAFILKIKSQHKDK